MPAVSITKYEWDLDGNGSYETNTGTTATTTRSYASGATVTVGLRVTDNNNATATTTRSLTVRGSYNAAVLGTTGLIDYWRLGETSGTALADAIGAKTATAQGGVTLGAAESAHQRLQHRGRLRRQSTTPRGRRRSTSPAPRS